MPALADASPVFPYAAAPEAGSLTEVADGVLWLRLALPFALDHVNVYLLADDGGWAILDTGIANAGTREVWERVLTSPLLGGRSITRVIATHFHPDHVGLAGWLADRAQAPLFMSRTEYLFAALVRGHRDAMEAAEQRAFFVGNGLDAAIIAAVIGRGHAYLDMTTALPKCFTRLVAGETIMIGGRRFEIMTGGGHAPEQVMLLCRDAGLFFPADQVLARISPNIGVWAWEPAADPLGEYLVSLADLRQRVPDDVLTLPAHNLPFRGLAWRASELMHHHDERCARIADACAAPRSGAEIVPVLFRRPLDAHQTGFAFGEVMAHLNYMQRRGELLCDEATPVRRFVLP